MGRAIVLIQGPYDSRGKKVHVVNKYDVFSRHSARIQKNTVVTAGSIPVCASVQCHWVLEIESFILLTLNKRILAAEGCTAPHVRD